jgi:hypothetical protein
VTGCKANASCNWRCTTSTTWNCQAMKCTWFPSIGRKPHVTVKINKRMV